MKREEYREQLAETFIKTLEEKGLSWKQGWSKAGMPRNGVTGRAYNGVNAFMLFWTAQMKGYEDPRWVTFLQIEDKEGRYHKGQKWHLKKGSKACWVEYVMPRDQRNRKVITWEKFRDEIEGTPEEKHFGIAFRYAAVFNASQVEGMPELKLEESKEINAAELIDTISKNMGVIIHEDGGDRAFYRPASDTVHLPKRERFFSDYEYNATALHELSHASGATHRLGRDLSGLFGTESYAFEELVAEMSSCFTSAELPTPQGEEHIRNHQAYVKNWIQIIRDKPERLREAVKEATRAADYLCFKGGLIDEKEYLKAGEKIVEVPALPEPEKQMKLTRYPGIKKDKTRRKTQRNKVGR